MKIKFCSFLKTITFGSMLTFSAGAFAQYTSIPDPAFEKALIDLEIDNDGLNGKVLTSQINTIDTLYLANKGIVSLAGIEDFTMLGGLNASKNNLGSVDFSENTMLLSLDLDSNNISVVDFSENTMLRSLSLANNNVSVVDFSQNTMLELLNVGSNNLKSIDLSANTSLYSLKLNNNQLTALNIGNNDYLSYVDVTNNSALNSIYVSNVQLFNQQSFNFRKDINARWVSVNTSIPDAAFEQALIDLSIDKDGLNGTVATSAIENIEVLNVADRSITDLTGIEAFGSLIVLNASYNNIIEVNLKYNLALQSIDLRSNQLKSLDLTKNINLTNLNCFNNNGLKIICVANYTAVLANESFVKDLEAQWSESCVEYTSIPDVAFEKALIDLEIDNDGLNGKVLTSRINRVYSLYLVNLGIKNLKGIEDFTMLTYLEAPYNILDSIDLSQNVHLWAVNLSSNNLSTIDLSQNVNLWRIDLSRNNLSTIDLSYQKQLWQLNLDSNRLVALDLRGLKLIDSLGTIDNPELIEICIDVVSDKINHDFLNQINIDSTTHLSTNCGQITAINTALENPLSAIYPNPAHDIVTVALLDKAVVIVVDAMGREVYRADALAGDLTIDLQAFVPGVYAVVVRSATGQESYSLLIQ